MDKIDFLATDGFLLNGFLYKSKSRTKNVILAVHVMSSNCFKNRDEVIAKFANENDIDYFGFNNRGSELVRYIKKYNDGKKIKQLAGTSYEDVLEGYNDIVGAIEKLKDLGYENVYLQGHSLGSTKVVYTYDKFKKENNENQKNIKGIILLSLVDIPSTIKVYLKENYERYIKLAEDEEKSGNESNLMPLNSFIHPISVKTFLRYAKNNREINFASYENDKELKVLNNIDKPLFMRWGNDNEMILQNAEELIEMLNEKIKNNKKDIAYIDGADHGYTGKEEMLAKQIINFIKNI